MEKFTRRIIGFGVHSDTVDGVALCRMFLRAIRGHRLPKFLSSDHDPLYRFHQWEANLRILEVTEIKTVPHLPISHPFVKRLIGTGRREYLDRILFWTTADLEANLTGRTLGLAWRVPEPNDHGSAFPLRFVSYRWQADCRGLYYTPIAAYLMNSPWAGQLEHLASTSLPLIVAQRPQRIQTRRTLRGNKARGCADE